MDYPLHLNRPEPISKKQNVVCRDTCDCIERKECNSSKSMVSSSLIILNRLPPPGLYHLRMWSKPILLQQNCCASVLFLHPMPFRKNCSLKVQPNSARRLSQLRLTHPG